MKIVLDNGAFKPYKAHPEDAGFDIMAKEGRTSRHRGARYLIRAYISRYRRGSSDFSKARAVSMSNTG